MQLTHIWHVAERQGFEPWVGANRQRFSRPPHSTTLPPLRVMGLVRGGFSEVLAGLQARFQSIGKEFCYPSCESRQTAGLSTQKRDQFCLNRLLAMA